MSEFFAGTVTPMETGWYEGAVKTISQPRVSQNGNEYVNVQFDLDGRTEPVFQAATLEFYDRIVLATGNTDRDPTKLVGGRVAIRIDVDEWGNKTVRRIQAIDAPRTTEQFQAARTRVAVESPNVPTVNLDGI